MLPLLVAAQQAPADVLPQQLEAPRIGPLAHAQVMGEGDRACEGRKQSVVLLTHAVCARQVVALMASVIRFSPANLWLLMRGQGLRLLGLILRNAEHAFLTVPSCCRMRRLPVLGISSSPRTLAPPAQAKLWDAVKQIASAVRSYDDASISKEATELQLHAYFSSCRSYLHPLSHSRSRSLSQHIHLQLYRRLILDMRIWGRASVSVQEAVLADLKERVVDASDYMLVTDASVSATTQNCQTDRVVCDRFKVMRSCNASEILLDSLALIYWVRPLSAQ